MNINPLSLFGLFSTEGFPARWHCGSGWQQEPFWGWLHITADLLIWMAYTAIPITLLFFLRQRPQIPFSRLFWLFSLFILACGTTHLIDAAIFYWPIYRFAAVMKLATAVVSCLTVFALFPMIPFAMTFRSPRELEQEIASRTRELQDLNIRLQAEIAARHTATQLLTTSETRLRLALEAGDMGTWDWNLSTDQVEFDSVEVRLTGLGTPAGMIDIKDFFERVVESDRPGLIEAIERTRREGCDYRHEFRYRRDDGVTRWLAGRGRVIHDRLGGPSRFVGVNFDVTDRRQLLEDLNLKTRAIESATNAIAIVDISQSDQPLIYANKAFCDLGGYPYEELLGRNCRLLQGPDSDPKAIQQMREAIQQRRDCEVVLLNYRKDGTPFWNHVHISPVITSGGEITHYVGIQSDITDRVETEQALVRAREEAESANVAKSHFLANMSHEIRTPLTAILGCADTLYRLVKDEETIELAKMVKDQGEWLLGILNDVLDVSKIEAGKLEIRLEQCDLVPIIADIRSLMTSLATEQGLELSVDYKTAVPRHITTDPLRLRQILLNLTSNAIKFTPQGKVGIHVRCDTTPESPQLMLDVIDTGVGIAPEKLDAIFAPFSQIEGPDGQKTRGTGLGLTICRSLVQLLGGRMSVRSIPGQGSRFTVRLPLTAEEAGDLTTINETTMARPEHEATDSMAVLIPCRVLVVEDTRGVQFMLKRMLQDFVGGVNVVSNGEEAIAAVMEAEQIGQPYDIILMDMQMPVMNGFEATARLRGSGFLRPIIALTAGAMSGDREKCLAAGCDAYLTKPVDRSRLLSLLIAYFDKE